MKVRTQMVTDCGCREIAVTLNRNLAGFTDPRDKSHGTGKQPLNDPMHLCLGEGLRVYVGPRPCCMSQESGRVTRLA